jgi:hypothetical protein
VLTKFINFFEESSYCILPDINESYHHIIILRLSSGYCWLHTLVENGIENVLWLNNNEIFEEDFSYLEKKYLSNCKKASHFINEIEMKSKFLINNMQLPLNKIKQPLDIVIDQLGTFSPNINLFENFFPPGTRMEIPIILGDVLWESIYIMEFSDGIFYFPKELNKSELVVFMKDAFDDFMFDSKIDDRTLQTISSNLSIATNLKNLEKTIYEIVDEIKKHMRLKMLFYNQNKKNDL